MNHELQEVFMKFHQKIATAFRQEAKSLPFTIRELEALRFVVEQKNPTMKEVAKNLSVTAPSATAMIEQLCAKKLIIRKLDPTDRRTVRIFPTKKAINFFTSFSKLKMKVFGNVLVGIDKPDQKTLIKILKKLI